MSKPQQKKPYTPFALRIMQFIFSRIAPLFPNYFGNLAYNLWFTTQRYKTPVAELPAKKSANISILNVHGLPVTLYQWGNRDAPKILFAHGWAGRGTQCASFIEPLLAAGFQVISFDGPAHGETPGKQTSILQFADVLLAIDKQHGPFAGALTHSFGGMLLAYAMTIGVNIQRIVCICPPDNFNAIFIGFQRTLNLPDSIMQLVDMKFYATHGYRIREEISTVHTVKTLSNHALIIHDEDDNEVLLSCGENVVAAWPNARLVITQGLGHRRIMKDSEVVKKAVEFLKL